MNIKEANKDPTVLAIRKDVIKARERKWKSKLKYAREHYLAMKKRGVYSMVVDEWDAFELEKLRYEENKIEGEMIMSERKVLVRLSKAFNNVEVEVNGIESKEEFVYESDWAKAEAVRMINGLPDDGFGKGKPTPKKEYTQQYTTPTPTTQQAPSQRVNSNDVTTKFLKGKQVEHAIKLINAGKLTLSQVNNLSSWDEQQALIYSEDNKKVLFGK